MRKLVLLATCAAVWLPYQLAASTVDLTFTGPGVSGNIQLTYGTATDSKYPAAFEVTGISGVFSDSNNGLSIVNAPVGPLEPINHASPEAGNLLAPNDFSKFAVAAGLPAQNNGFLTYDNLYYPAGSPQTATNYPGAGGILDIYGLMFDIGGGQVVDLWSNGDFGGGPDYGVAVGTSAMALDYVSGGVTVTPEPGPLPLLGAGLIGMLAWRTRRSLPKV